jgi:hypothetical protein
MGVNMSFMIPSAERACTVYFYILGISGTGEGGYFFVLSDFCTIYTTNRCVYKMSPDKFHIWSSYDSWLKFIGLSMSYGRHVMFNFLRKKYITFQTLLKIRNLSVSLVTSFQNRHSSFVYYRTLVGLSTRIIGKSPVVWCSCQVFRKWSVVYNADGYSWIRRLTIVRLLLRFRRRNPKETSVYTLCLCCTFKGYDRNVFKTDPAYTKPYFSHNNKARNIWP